MSLPELFIRRPIATVLLTLGLSLAGIAAFFLLPVSPLPQVALPTIQVSASLPGASPETMATSVATPLEKRLGIISDVSELTSQSRVGQTNVTLQFGLDRDIDGAARDVQAAINAARIDLPETLRTNPTYRKQNPADAPVLILALTSATRTPGQIYDVASTIIQQQLSQVKGVGDVVIGGASLPAVRVEMNPLALARYRIGLEDVRAALSSANANRPKGIVQDSQTRFQIYTNDTGLQASAYAPVIIAYRNGAPVRLSDIADVEDGVTDVHNFGLFNGRPAIVVQVLRQPAANIIDTVDRVKALLPTLRAVLPADIDMQVAADRTLTIRASVAEVERTVLLSIALVVAVVAFFLHNGRAVLIPSVAVAVSLLGALGVMFLLGYSLDNLSLMALTVSTGFVVDDAIVVLENVTRHVEAGMSRVQAALQGSKEVAFTVFSISVSLVAVFIPILLMGGIVGRLFREFAMTLTAAILVSLVISLTTTPMMCAFLIGPPRPRERRGRLARMADDIFARMQRVYTRALDWALDAGPLMLVVLAVTIVLFIYLTIITPKGFFPQQDTGQMIGGLQSDQSSSFTITRQRMYQLVHILGRDPAVATEVAFAGNNASGGFMFVTLKPKGQRSPVEQVIARLRPKLAQIVGVSLFLNPVGDVQVGGRQSNATYQFTLQADNLTDLRNWASRLAERMKTKPDLVDVNTDQEDHGLESFITIDWEKAARLHLTNNQIDNTLYDGFGQRQVSTIYKETNQYKVVMEVDPRFSQDPTLLEDVYVSNQAASATTNPAAATPAFNAVTPFGTTPATLAAKATGAPVAVTAAPRATTTPATVAAKAIASTLAITAATPEGSTPSTTGPSSSSASPAAAATSTAVVPVVANNAPGSANSAGQPGAVSSLVGSAVAVGVTAVAGPAAPPGRAASQGVAVSVTPEQLTPLAAIARWADQATPTSVNHQNTEPATTISFNLPPGKSLSDATRAITEAQAEIHMPATIHGSFQGTAKVFQQSLSSEPLLVLAALVAIYVVLGILYESYVHPLTVLSTLPSAGIGAVIALIVFHTEFSIIALIGVILLIGIVKKNAILMIDFAIEAERGGVSAYDAIRQAAITRFRPIMMTTFAAILGAVPLAIGWGDGAELRRPLGLTIIGGLLVSQVITLLTTPVVYLYLNRLRGRRRARGSGPYPSGTSTSGTDPVPVV
jgi:multidrug efflux pump